MSSFGGNQQQQAKASKRVRFSDVYLAICIPTGEKRIVPIGPEHYRKPRYVPDLDNMPEHLREAYIRCKQQQYDRYNTVKGFLSQFVSMCKDRDHEHLNHIDPEKFLRVCYNVVNNVEPIISDEKVFNANWKCSYKFGSCIPELKATLGTIYEQLNKLTKDYYEKARAHQQPFKDKALYLSKEQVKKFKQIYSVHFNVFAKSFHKLITHMCEHLEDNDIRQLEEAATTALIKMDEFKLTPDDLKEIAERVKNGNIYRLIQTCYTTFKDNIPVNKVCHLVKFHTVDNDKDCEAFEAFDYLVNDILIDDDTHFIELNDVVREYKEYGAKSNNPLRPRLYPCSGFQMRITDNYNI